VVHGFTYDEICLRRNNFDKRVEYFRFIVMRALELIYLQNLIYVGREVEHSLHPAPRLRMRGAMHPLLQCSSKHGT